MNMSRIASLMPTMIVLVRADSLTPAMSTAAMARITNTAGTLNVPPSPGARAIASGSVIENTESRMSLKYSPQPTAMAATESPYSSTRSHPMIQATSSPIVA
jgi:hypothetical protein